MLWIGLYIAILIQSRLTHVTHTWVIFFFLQLLLYEKIIAMQEPIDNDLREMGFTREEELMMMEKEELIKHILRLEAEYYANQKDEELPW